MKTLTARQFKWFQFALVLLLAFAAAQTGSWSALAAPQPSAQLPGSLVRAALAPAAQSSAIAPASLRAAAPALSCGSPIPAGCNSLQVIMIIDDSGSMAYNDPQNTRFQGVENMLDILAKEYYLPALDANLTPPDIQVAFIHFSSGVMNTPAWKPLNPKNLADWDTQAKAFAHDITGKLNTSQPLFTDFKPALNAAVTLANAKPQTADCPRLVMLFTDGVPNLGVGDLKGAILTSYMDGLKAILAPAFPRPNDYLYVTAFESRAYSTFWSGIYQQKWQEITRDPNHASYVPTPNLAPHMEEILGATIGRQSHQISPSAQDPTQYSLAVPELVQSLRLTYYKLNPTSSMAVTDPQGKAIVPNGQDITLSGINTAIEVLTIKNPAAGPYQIKTSAKGGIVSKLILYQPVTVTLAEPTNPLLLFTSAVIRLQVVDGSGKAVPTSFKWEVKADLVQSGQTPFVLQLTQLNENFLTAWRPLSTDEADLNACAALYDADGVSFELFNGPVGKIQIDPLGVQASPPSSGVCVPSGGTLAVPLQIVNGRTQKSVPVAFPVDWQAQSATSPGGQVVASSVSARDAPNGAYTLTLTPRNTQAIQSNLTAAASVNGKSYPFYSGQVSTSSGMTADQKVSFSLGAPQTLGDSFSVLLNQWFHADLFKNGAVVLLGRHLFGWFGPSQVQIPGQFHLSDPQNNTAGISLPDFTVQLVSQSGGANSSAFNAWQNVVDGSGTLVFPAPGLGLYTVQVAYQGKLPNCAVLADLPTQTLLLINDFWEYLFWLLLILLLILLLLWLLLWRRCRIRGRLWGVLAILDPKGKVSWKVELEGDEEKEKGRRCYDWDIDDSPCGIRRLRLQSWNERSHVLILKVWHTAGGEGSARFERSLDKWEDIVIGDCLITWWPEGPGEEYDEPGGDPEDEQKSIEVDEVILVEDEEVKTETSEESDEHRGSMEKMEVEEIDLVESEPVEKEGSEKDGTGASGDGHKTDDEE